MQNIINDDLKNLRKMFQIEGFDIRVVGGFVRDTIMGIVPKDIDMATDATPDQQIGIYKKNNIHYIPTGLQHGTISVVINGEVYEITTLRYETDHDGRHATVHYTNDWIKDLSRRDLTINAMAMTFDGEIIDPFNGQDDIKNGVVRFVGNAAERIQEDALRIARFYRFLGRMNGTIDQEAKNAIIEYGHGLSNISKERVWSEMAKIISGPNAPMVINAMYEMGVHMHIGMGVGNIAQMESASKYTKNPISLMVALLSNKNGTDMIANPFVSWKMSSAETSLATFLTKNGFFKRDLKAYEEMIVLNKSLKDHVVELCKVAGQPDMADIIQDWESPTFPIKGDDFIAHDVSPKQIGVFLKQTKDMWFKSDYTMTKDEMMNSVGF